MADLSDIETLRSHVRKRMEDLGLNVSQLAEASGVHRATIHRFLDENYQFTPSLRTMRLLIAVLDDNWSPDARPKPQEVETPTPILPVGAIACAGLWLSYSQRESMRKASSPLARSTRPSSEAELALLMSGNSCEPIFQDGDVLRAIEFGPSKFSMPKGSYLVILGYRLSSNELEITVREVVEETQDLVILEFPSTSKLWKRELELPKLGVARVDGVDYHAWGIVSGFYRELSRESA